MDKIDKTRAALVALVWETAQAQMHPKSAEQVLMPAAEAYTLAVLDEAEAVVRHYFPGNESILEEFRALRGRLEGPQKPKQ